MSSAQAHDASSTLLTCGRRGFLAPLLLLTLLLSACGHTGAGGNGVGGGATQSGSLTVGGIKRTYLVHTPPGFPGTRTWPLVLALHGGGGQGSGQESLSGFDGVADAHGFVVVYPNGLNKHWNDGRGIASNSADDLGFLSALISTLVADAHIDAARVYVTGMSNGGMMTQYAGCQLSAQVAAIAPVAGLMPSGDAAACAPTHPMPVLVFQGTADPLMPPDGGMVRCDPSLTDCGTVLSTTATMTLWAQLNGCGTTATSVPLPDLDKNDGPPPSHDSTVQRVAYTGCPRSAPVELYSVRGGGHTWAGGRQYLPAVLVGYTNRDASASDVIWQFFSQQHLS